MHDRLQTPDERRIYYDLMGAGRTALEAELKRYRGVVAVAEGRLAGHRRAYNIDDHKCF